LPASGECGWTLAVVPYWRTCCCGWLAGWQFAADPGWWRQRAVAFVVVRPLTDDTLLTLLRTFSCTALLQASA
jgi:hypothetical protein